MSNLYEAAVREAREVFRPQTLTVGVWHDGKEEYFTYGRVSHATRRADQDTVFPIASVSKSFIAAAVWMLVEEGKVDITAPVTRYLPGFAMYTEELTQKLTVRDALCHCCGLARHDITLYTLVGLPLEQMVETIRYLPPSWPLGSRYGYSNHMFATISLLVEKVSGMPWGDFVKERIFKPLGMDRSYTKSLAFRGVDDNYARPRKQVNGRNCADDTEITDHCGCSGSISASARDLLQWAKLNLRGGVLPDGTRLYSEEAERNLHGEQTYIDFQAQLPFKIEEIERLYYGMGWSVERFRGERLIYHGGAITGFRSTAGFMPDKDFAYVVLANLSNSPVCEAVARSMCDVRLGLDDADWSKRFFGLLTANNETARGTRQFIIAPPEQPPETRGIAGRYESKGYGVFVFTERGGKLKMHVEGVDSVRPLQVLPSKQFQWAIDIPNAEMAMPCSFEFEDGRAVRAHIQTDAEIIQPMVFDRL